jgi:hypothetical protein
VLLTLPTAQLNPTSTPTIVLAVAARAKAAFTLMVTTRRLFGINFLLLAQRLVAPTLAPPHRRQPFPLHTAVLNLSNLRTAANF